MQITVLKETQADESRVALIPESVKKLIALKARIAVESNAGQNAGASDADYEAAGASVSGEGESNCSPANAIIAANRDTAIL